jgi:hypothetical protein
MMGWRAIVEMNGLVVFEIGKNDITKSKKIGNFCRNSAHRYVDSRGDLPGTCRVEVGRVGGSNVLTL